MKPQTKTVVSPTIENEEGENHGLEEIKGKNHVSFPWKLHTMLEEAEEKGFTSIVSWTSKGKAFCIFDRTKFEEDVMPIYFVTSRFKSFHRSLNLWGFKADTVDGTGTSSNGLLCNHPCFVRGKPEDCSKMRRVRNKGLFQRRNEDEKKASTIVGENRSRPSVATTANSDVPSMVHAGRLGEEIEIQPNNRRSDQGDTVGSNTERAAEMNYLPKVDHSLFAAMPSRNTGTHNQSVLRNDQETSLEDTRKLAQQMLEQFLAPQQCITPPEGYKPQSVPNSVLLALLGVNSLPLNPPAQVQQLPLQENILSLLFQKPSVPVPPQRTLSDMNPQLLACVLSMVPAQDLKDYIISMVLQQNFKAH